MHASPYRPHGTRRRRLPTSQLASQSPFGTTARRTRQARSRRRGARLFEGGPRSFGGRERGLHPGRFHAGAPCGHATRPGWGTRSLLVLFCEIRYLFHHARMSCCCCCRRRRRRRSAGRPGSRAPDEVRPSARPAEGTGRSTSHPGAIPEQSINPSVNQSPRPNHATRGGGPSTQRQSHVSSKLPEPTRRRQVRHAHR
jgi:hypothetical protein